MLSMMFHATSPCAVESWDLETAIVYKEREQWPLTFDTTNNPLWTSSPRNLDDPDLAAKPMVRASTKNGDIGSRNPETLTPQNPETTNNPPNSAWKLRSQKQTWPASARLCVCKKFSMYVREMKLTHASVIKYLEVELACARELGSMIAHVDCFRCGSRYPCWWRRCMATSHSHNPAGSLHYNPKFTSGLHVSWAQLLCLIRCD